MTIDVKPSEAGDKVAVKTDVVGGIHYPVYKPAVSAEGVEPVPVSADNPMPVTRSSPDNFISTANSYAAATLAAGATFQGTVEMVTRSGRIGVAIKTDNATDGVLTIEVSHDGVIWGGPTRNWSDTRSAEPHMWEIVEKYWRILYTNGTTEATNISIQTHFSSNGGILLAHQLDKILLDENQAIITRAVSVSKDNMDNYVNVGAVTKHAISSQYFVDGYTNTFSVHLDHTLTPNGTDVAYMLVDVSNAAVWPHTLTGGVILRYVIIEIDPEINFSGDCKIGYLKNVDATNGDFVTILDVDLRSQSDIFHEEIEFGSQAIHCSDTSHFGPTDVNNTLFQTDVNLGGPDAPGTLTYPSGDGDLVMIVAGTISAVGVSITLGYETVE
ncbi:MAG: hypothetical protein Unbinned7794contig1000_3 [Prokaryotic dsDNA virus sp.]|nr:MAG: hypothetical protein Unbinned7794contig1000_3 [Prokaryotic dsDNA virus sp.]|tara:strand:+ start:18917 stop:20068 length:1152 start_codon:yes stop_codon:yes gene_type:complete